MHMGVYVGKNSDTTGGGYIPVAKKVSKIYVGDGNGIARLVKKAYVGVDGKAKLFWGGIEIPDEQLVNYLMLYDNGDECVDVTGGWKQATFKRNGSSPCTFYYTKNSDNMYMGIYGKDSSDYPRNSIVTEKPFNFSEYKGIGCSSQIITDRLCFGAGDTNESFTGRADQLIVRYNTGFSMNKTYKNVQCQLVDTFPDTYYPIFWIYASWEKVHDSKGYIYSLFAYKEDNWQELCTIAGLTPSDYADVKTLCADSTAISTILSDENAVKYMIYNCTGSYMCRFMESSTCLTALNNSPYKTLIQANEHWNKFLNMVA